MQIKRHLRDAMVWLAAAGLCLPIQIVSGQQPSPLPARESIKSDNRTTIQDVALQSGGLLVGQVRAADSRPIADSVVTIHSSDVVVATTRTDANGFFAVAGLRGGVHQVATLTDIETCRLWSPGTAPPRADQQLQLIENRDVLVRGQMHPPHGVQNFVRTTKRWATNPFVVGTVVAAAVAIPVALHNADKDRAGS